MPPWAWSRDQLRVGCCPSDCSVILTVPLSASTSQVRDCTCLRYSLDSCFAWRRASLFRLAASERSANCQEEIRDAAHQATWFCLRVYLSRTNEKVKRSQTINEGVMQAKFCILSSNLSVCRNMSKFLFRKPKKRAVECWSRNSLHYSHLKRVEVKVIVLGFTLKQNQWRVIEVWVVGRL